LCSSGFKQSGDAIGVPIDPLVIFQNNVLFSGGI